jgi:hypothetical protein
MNVIIKDFLKRIAEFFAVKQKRRLFFLCLLGVFALSEFLILGLVRRTFVFYSIDKGMPVVEDRMLLRADSKEADIRRYAEEVLLGPVSLDSAPLFPKETRLRSLLYRDGVVYVDLSESAALPPVEGGEAFNGFYTLNTGIRRNFSYVRDVRFFIAGNEAFFEKFREIFAGITEK